MQLGSLHKKSNLLITPLLFSTPTPHSHPRPPPNLTPMMLIGEAWGYIVSKEMWFVYQKVMPLVIAWYNGPCYEDIWQYVPICILISAQEIQ